MPEEEINFNCFFLNFPPIETNQTPHPSYEILLTILKLGGLVLKLVKQCNSSINLNNLFLSRCEFKALNNSGGQISKQVTPPRTFRSISYSCGACEMRILF